MHVWCVVSVSWLLQQHNTQHAAIIQTLRFILHETTCTTLPPLLHAGKWREAMLVPTASALAVGTSIACMGADVLSTHECLVHLHP